MRDLIASLLRMVNLRNEYFMEQFDSETERSEVILDLLSPGNARNEDARGGILRNFDLQNINAKLAQDQNLSFVEGETYFTSDPLIR
jgi:hypothetical protein